MATSLVTGAPGFVGSHLCRELHENGHSVRALHRASSDLSALEGTPVELVEGDITTPKTLEKAFDGVDTVYHIAALFREAKHGDDVYHSVNVEGTRNVLEQAIASGVKRVIHCSTVGVHSHIPSPPATENEAYRPGDIYQHTKCEGEKVALEYFSSGKIAGTVIRPAMIWGPGDRRMVKLFKGIAERKLPVIGSGKTLVHWVLVDDLVRAFRLAGEADSADGQIYIIAGEKPVTMKTLYETIASELGVSLLPIRVPAAPMQALGSITEAVCIPFGIEPPLYRRRVDFFTKTRAFDCTKAQVELGYSAAGALKDEVAKIVADYRERGWIPRPTSMSAAA